MDQLTQADIIDMYRSQVSNMEGGRRRRVGRPRKSRGRGLVGGVADASANVEGYISGMGLVGGRRRVGRPRKNKMTAKVLEFFASKGRKKRGRGLVGGKTNQEIYDELVDNGQSITPAMLEMLKAGIQPATPKETIIRRIRALEKKIGVGQSSAERLNKYSLAALRDIYELYNSKKDLLAYPPISADASDLYGATRFDDYVYDGISPNLTKEELTEALTQAAAAVQSGRRK